MKKQFTNSLLLMILVALIVATAWKAVSEPSLILASIILTISTCIFRAYQRGIYREFFTLLRFFGSLTVGWYLSADVGEALGLPVMLAAISGFYLTFIGLFLISGALIKWFSPEKKELSVPTKMLGGLLGGFEGLIIAWLLVFTVAMLPGSKLADYYHEFAQFTRPIENMLTPIMPEEAVHTVEMVKTVQRVTRNFKPENVDRAALQEILMPLAEMPEIITLQQDEGLRELIRERNFKAVLNYPALRNFLESEELRTKMQSIDLKKLERALIPEFDSKTNENTELK